MASAFVYKLWMHFLSVFLLFFTAISSAQVHCELIFANNKGAGFSVQQKTLIYNRARKNILRVHDIRQEKEYLYAELNDRGELYFTMHLVDWQLKQRVGLYGPRLYREMIEYFSVEKIEKIIGVWVDGSNLLAYQKARGMGLNEEQAALSTWSGRQASLYGFKRVVTVDEMTNLLNGVESVRVEFAR